MNSLLDTRMTTLQPSNPRRWLSQRGWFLLLWGYGAACLAFVLVVSFLLLSTIRWSLSQGRVDHAWLDIRNIGGALKISWVKTGRYPTTEEGLRALLKARYLEAVPRDPWDNEYHYLLWQGCPVVWSYGRDGAPGGEGQDADLSTMGSSPPLWILQRAALSAPRPFSRSCPWTLDQEG